MIRSLLPISLFALLMVFGSGCCGYRYGTCGGGGCGSAIDPMLGDCGACGGCGECGSCMGPRPWGCGRPARWCGNGCGERYYGEWISDGPSGCDSCDDCGGWVAGGGYYYPHPLWNGFKSLFGFRYGPGYYGGMDWGCSGPSGCSGCSSCGMGGLSPIEADEVVENIETVGSSPAARSASPRSSGPHPARRPQGPSPETRAQRSHGNYARPTTYQRMPVDGRYR